MYVCEISILTKPALGHPCILSLTEVPPQPNSGPHLTLSFNYGYVASYSYLLKCLTGFSYKFLFSKNVVKVDLFVCLPLPNHSNALLNNHISYQAPYYVTCLIYEIY